MLDRDGLKELARATGLRLTDLVPMAPANDPFLANQPARRAAAVWFTRLYEQYGFGAGVHLRRIHYRIVSSATPVLKPDGTAYENTDRSWKLLVNAGRDARYLGLVPAEHFVDRRNPDPVIHARPDMQMGTDLLGSSVDAGAIDDFPDAPGYWLYARDKAPCPYLLELWCEKTTVNDVLLPICEARGANLITGMGELSETATRLVIERVVTSGKPTRIFYISDFDPAGRSMPLAVSRRLQFAIVSRQLDVDLKLIPLVLTEEQCLAYRLPRTPIKETELRASKFEARFGAGATELDALEALHPGVLGQTVTEALGRYWDGDYQRVWHAALDEYRHVLRRHNERLLDERPEMPDLLRRHDELVDLWQAFCIDVTAVFDDVARQLAEDPPDSFVPPRQAAADEVPDEDVLFDSHRGYLVQADAYRRFKVGDISGE